MVLSTPNLAFFLLGGALIGAGIALNQGASIPNTVLGFAILVALGVSLSGWVLLTGGQRTATKGDQPRPSCFSKKRVQESGEQSAPT